eukprot:NODE_12922_length_1196_cov_3.641721.p1 GENE.NODE_12922_length_1196_cov_3.641721~~NODE_12922_length_1196_cov_3.641721.p1  ORF type:complete len:311 (+),score=79.30 NODE_12922_length_1196_cov_3.641721:106-933(+)
MALRPSSAGVRRLTTALGRGRRFFSDDGEVPKWQARYPQRYFDFKAFRESLKGTKDRLAEAERREVRREYALPPPDGWTVSRFLEEMKFGADSEDVANLFERWEDFISMRLEDIRRIPDLTGNQRRQLNRYITLFNHGLWPKVSAEEFHEHFQGKPLKRQGQAWTQEEDRELKRLAKLYDINFGDPWIYLSWEMQRRMPDVRQRYIELVVKPADRASRWELAITKSSRPLLMNRRFRMIPPDLYIVPSAENYPLQEVDRVTLPAAFQKYRQDDIF